MTGHGRWEPAYPIPPRDRMWCGTRSTRLFLGLARPEPEQLRTALRALATVAPSHRIFSAPAPDGRRWARVPAGDLLALCDRMVVTDPEPAGDHPEAVLARIHNATGRRPAFQFTLGDDYLAVRTEHAVTDGSTLTRWLSVLWRCAQEGRSPLQMVIRNPRLPVVRGLAHALREDPRRPLTMMAGLRSRTPRRTTGDDVRVWTPAPTTIAASGTPEALAELRRWRDQRAPGVSVASTLFAAARRALHEEGIVPGRPGMSVVVDTRRYFPPGTLLEGNFAAGVYLEPTDPTSPASVHTEMRRAIDTGRPLASLALGAAHETVSRVATRATAVAADARPLLTLTHLGRLTGFENIPWAAAPVRPRMLSLTTPWLPEDLTLFMSELHGAVHVSAAYNAGVLPEAGLRRAVEALADNPVAVLGEGRRAEV